MEQEEWRPVVGYEDFYEVSDMGRVKSVPRKGTKGGILKPGPDGGGYLHVDLSKNGEKESFLVHILVMRAFVGKCHDGHEIDHLDGNPKNNRLTNLDAKTHKENMQNPITKKRQKEASKKRSQDPEWLKNVSEAAKKRSQDPEWLRKNAEQREKMHQDPEWRKKQAEATRKARCKPVDQFTTDGQFVKRWPGAREAARKLGVNNRNISECCKGKRKTAGGFIWKFSKEAV